MNAETKFTAGPWVAREDTNAILGDDWMIGRPNGKPDEVAVCSKRDAHLIAAAPELYALVAKAESLISGDLVGPEWKQACHEFVAEARAALAKAVQS